MEASAVATTITPRIVATLSDMPEWIEAVEAIVAWHEAHPPEEQYNGMQFGFEWFEPPCPPHLLNRLVLAGIIEVRGKSRSSTHYRLIDLAATKEALDVLNTKPTPISAAAAKGEVPLPELFTLVVGLESAKTVLNAALSAERAIHVLLVGPPGSAKTLMISDIASLPGAEFYAGSTTTKSGLVGLLLSKQPKYLILDEIDKMDSADLTPLLNLMEGGVVTLLQHKIQERKTMGTRVFAAANDERRISAPILSRFAKVRLPEYTRDEFLTVSERVLIEMEALAPNVARLVALEVAVVSRDVRDAIRIGRMAKRRPQDIADLVKALFPGGRVSPLREVAKR